MNTSHKDDHMSVVKWAMHNWAAGAGWEGLTAPHKSGKTCDHNGLPTFYGQVFNQDLSCLKQEGLFWGQERDELLNLL